MASKIIRYAKESRHELGKVIWPSKRELTNHTIVVVAVSVAIAAFIGAIDYIANVGFEQFLRLR